MKNSVDSHPTLDTKPEHINERVNILGVGVSAIDINSALSIINKWVEESVQKYICVTGVHGVIESQRDETIRAIHNRAGLVTPDGMPLVWLSRLKIFRVI